MKLSYSLCICTLLLVALSHAQLSPVVQDLVNDMLAMQDTTADPCTDFYQYACGNFIKNNPVPDTPQPINDLPVFKYIMQGNDEKLAQLVEEDWPVLHDVYESCLQSNLTDDFTQFFKTVVTEIDEIDISTPAELWTFLGQVSPTGAPAFMSISVQVGDNQEPVIFILPAGNTYHVDDYDDPVVYDALLLEMQNAFELVESSQQAQSDALYAMSMELFIAHYSNSSGFSSVQVGDLIENTGIDFFAIFDAAGISASNSTNASVYNIEYFAKLGSAASSIPAHAVQKFVEWKIYQTLYSFNLTACWSNDTSNLPYTCNYVMQNAPTPAPWDQPTVCRYFVHFLMPDYVGLIFSDEVVTSDVVTAIHDVTVGIQTAFNESLPSLGWLDSSSIGNVQFKLANILQIIGHPNILEKYNNITTSPTTFYLNFLNILAANGIYASQVASAPFNRSDFTFDPMVVNAFYSPNTNTINFPAGILESYMFNVSWPKLFQYGRLGYVVGHENTHGFDNSGSMWNAYGLPDDILDNTTRTNFNNNAQCIVNLYDTFIQYNTTHVDGQKTLGENIADIGGVKNSYRAYQNYIAEYGPEFKDYQLISNLTTDQVFFLFLGQTWCASQNLAYKIHQYQVDVHSPARYRVIGPLSQFDQFAAAYNCPANTTMNPASRCDLW